MTWDDAEILEGMEPLEEVDETSSDLLALTEAQCESLERTLQEFPKLFSEQPGRTSVVSHTIHAKGAVPIRQRAYRVPYSQQEQVQKEIMGMLEAGVIHPSKSPWASPMVLVPKKGGGPLSRLCHWSWNRIPRSNQDQVYPGAPTTPDQEGCQSLSQLGRLLPSFCPWVCHNGSAPI